MPQYLYVLILVIVISFSPIVEAKKRCKPLLTKLHNIQALQRTGYSSKRGSSLRIREDKARNKWWQCENGRRDKQKKNKHKVSKKSTSYTTNNLVKSKKAIRKKIVAGMPFETSNAIVITSKYQGEKKRAWLVFYQQPTRCQRPKNLQVFAFCSENKQTQRITFDKQYQQVANLNATH